MKSHKVQTAYIFVVLLILVIFSNQSYSTLAHPSFLVPVISIAIIMGITGVYLFGKDNRYYKILYLVSYLMTIGLIFVPRIGMHTDNGTYFYGFPAQWFTYYNSSGGSVSFGLGGFLINYFIIYFILLMLIKIYLRFFKRCRNLDKA